MIEFQFKEALLTRIKEQVDLEILGNVSELYEYIYPPTNAKRISERSDEPNLTKDSIRSFTDKVTTAHILETDIENYHHTSSIYKDSPSALVITKIQYNKNTRINKFRTIWVLYKNVWYSTALNRSWRAT